MVSDAESAKPKGETTPPHTLLVHVRFLEEESTKGNGNAADTDKKAADVDWLKLAELAQNRFFGRRGIEWKLVLGLWTVILAIPAGVLYKDVNFPTASHWGLMAAYGFAWVITVVFWHLPIQLGHAADRRKYEYYIEKAEGKKPPPLPLDEPSGLWQSLRRIRPRSRMWLIGQALMSLLLLLLSWYVIYLHVSKIDC